MTTFEKLQRNGIGIDLMELEERLREIFGRPVDIVEPDSLTNPVRRRSILVNTERLYAAQRLRSCLSH